MLYPNPLRRTLLRCASPHVCCYTRSTSDLPANRLRSLQDPEDPGHMRISLAYTTGKEWYYVRRSASSNESTLLTRCSKKMRETDWFQDFLKNVKPLWVKPRKLLIEGSKLGRADMGFFLSSRLSTSRSDSLEPRLSLGVDDESRLSETCAFDLRQC